MSTEKQLENIGKVVKEVKVLKSGVKVTFEDGDSVLLDVNSYVNGERLYKGKELSEIDYHFDYEGMDARFCEEFDIEEIIN